ncbi:MAG: ATPase [Chloroflexi bacterium]|nr:MAG: ATPase [Chloroflexota bacterium]
MVLRRLANEYYRELFENASDAIWIHDMKGRVIAANRAAERLSGYSVDEQYDLKVSDFLDEEALARAREVRRRLLRGEPVTERYEQRIRRRDGSEAIIEVATSLITVDGRPFAFQHIARDVTEARRMRDALRFYLQAILRAQEDERKRIARELHDETVQSLLLLIRRLDSMLSSGKRLSKAVRQELEQLHSLAVEICEGLWRYARDLRPRILDDMGLVAGLEYLANELQESEGIRVIVQAGSSETQLSAESQLVMFRIAQEALNNVRRHAGASEVVISLDFVDDRARMTITDNGKGFELPKQIGDFTGTGRLGLLGMYERARLLGGAFEIESEPGKGTKVVAELPRRATKDRGEPTDESSSRMKDCH